MDPEIIGYKITKYVEKLKNASTPAQADMYRERLKDYHSYNKQLSGINITELKTSVAENCKKFIKLVENGTQTLTVADIHLLNQINSLLIEYNSTAVIRPQSGGGAKEIQLLHSTIMTGLSQNPYEAQQLLSSYVNVSNQHPDKHAVKTMTNQIIAKMNEEGIDVENFNTGFAIFSKL